MQIHKNLSDPDFEPSDEELDMIMSDATAGVAQRAKEAGNRLQERLDKTILENESDLGKLETNASDSLITKPALIVIAGPNGSGKTTITKSILSHHWSEGCVYVNPDDIANDRFGDWNSPEASLNAARYAEKMREDCLAKKQELIFETVMSAQDKVGFIRKAKSAGFFVRLFFICTTTPKINASRVAARVMEGGHDVPIGKIISRYTKSIANCAAVLKDVDRAYLYDNSADNQDPSLLFRVSDGILSKAYADTLPAWANSLRQSLVGENEEIVRAGTPLRPGW